MSYALAMVMFSLGMSLLACGVVAGVSTLSRRVVEGERSQLASLVRE